MNRVPMSELRHDSLESIYLRDGEPFTGTAYNLYPDGSVEGEIEYRYGLRWGVTRSWHEDGRPATEGHFLRDVQHGMAWEWDESGRVTEESCCEYGVVIYERAWDEDGDLTRDYRIEEGSRDFERLRKRRELAGDEEPSLVDCTRALCPDTGAMCTLQAPAWCSRDRSRIGWTAIQPGLSGAARRLVSGPGDRAGSLGKTTRPVSSRPPSSRRGPFWRRRSTCLSSGRRRARCRCRRSRRPSSA
jgi:hypothetical protein